MEDNLFVFKAVYFANKVTTIPDAFYNYVHNPDSICQSKDPIKSGKRLEDRKYICAEMLKFALAHKYGTAAMQEFREFLGRRVWGGTASKVMRNADARLRKQIVKSFGWQFLVFHRFRIIKKIARFFYREVAASNGDKVIKIFKMPLFRYKDA
jgi:hypothetical protein